MRNFYFSYIAESNGKQYSSWNSFRWDENLLEFINKFTPVRPGAVLTEFTLCETRTQAVQMTALRNQIFRQNGTHIDGECVRAPWG